MRTAEQNALAEAVADVLKSATDLEGARSGRLNSSIEPLGRLGVVDILLDGDGTIVDLCVVAEEGGRACSAIAAAEAAIGVAQAAGHVGSPDAVVLPVLGDSVIAEWDDAGQVKLRGESAALVLSDEVAAFLVVAPTQRDGSWVAAFVERSAVQIELRTTLDLSRPYASLRFDCTVPATLLEDDSVIHDQLALLAMADSIGAAEALLEMTVAHAQSRMQFGAVIGSFQAVKHHCATMRSDLASARAALGQAAEVAAVESAAARALAVSTAALHVFPATSSVASTALQIHGGMGFTWEHDLHLYLRRVKVNELLHGHPLRHRARVASLL